MPAGCRKVGKQSWGGSGDLARRGFIPNIHLSYIIRPSALEFDVLVLELYAINYPLPEYRRGSESVEDRRLEQSYTGSVSFGTMNKSCDEIPVGESSRPREPPEPLRTQVPPPEDDSPPASQSPVTSPNTARPGSSMTTQTIVVPEDQQDIEADDVGLFTQAQPC